jgi:hypothetical protein
MGTGSGRPVQVLRVVALVALVAAAGTACGSSSSSDSKRVPVSVAEANSNPCLLVSQSQATAILGSGTKSEIQQAVAGVFSECDYDFASSGPIAFVSVTLETGPTAALAATGFSKNPAPAAGVGHGATCGTDKVQADLSDLVSQIDSEDWLVIAGPSCAVDGKFDEAAYGNL